MRKVRCKARRHLLLVQIDQVRELSVLLARLRLVGLSSVCTGRVDRHVEVGKRQLVIELGQGLAVLVPHVRQGVRLECARLLLGLSLSRHRVGLGLASIQLLDLRQLEALALRLRV